MKKILIDDNLKRSAEIASELFFAGKIFIMPTDTIYGFSGDPLNLEVKSEIAKIKGREESKKFILLINDIQEVKKIVDLKNKREEEFLENIWPNPVSVILNLNEEYKEKFDSPTVAFRIPKHDFCSMFLDMVKLPVISTSVNRSGNSPLTDQKSIIEEFGNEIDAIFFSEKNVAPVASTLIDLTKNEPVLIREGGVKFAEIISKF